MSEGKELKQNFKEDAKIITDRLFEAKLFRDEITRDDMNAVENYIRECMSLRFTSYIGYKSLMDRIEQTKTENK